MFSKPFTHQYNTSGIARAGGRPPSRVFRFSGVSQTEDV